VTAPEIGSATGPRRLSVSPKAFSRLALASFIGLGLIVISGAAVRLTGSGLGCPDWPTCYKDRLTVSTQLHPLIEFSNRMVTVALVVVIGATVIGAYRRSTRRSDLVWLSWSLVAGVIGDAVLGAVVVYTKLNPYLVMVHMWFSLALLVVGIVLYHRSRYDYSPGARAEVANQATRKVAWALDALFVCVVIAGTAATGSGPHAGGSEGQVIARRLPVALRDVVMAHSSFAVAFLGAVLATFLILDATGAPGRLRGAAKRLLVVGVAQGAIGFLQYATHLPALLVELHVLGAVSLTIGVTTFQLSQVARDKDPDLAAELAAAAT
jgi:cytochrome c oxidase assembly protein subunit 15